jgi:transcriptional regulator with XRE-family HTH domain
MPKTPDAQQIAEAAGVTPAYARMLLAGKRQPSLALALALHDKLGWQCGSLVGAQKRDIEAARRFVEARAAAKAEAA